MPTTYATVEDVRDVLKGTQGDIPGTAADLTDLQLEEAIDNAENQVNSALGGRYDVPFSPSQVPNIVHTITRDIACYLADLTYRMGREYLSEANPLRLRYQRAKEMLYAIRDGKSSIEDLPSGDDGKVGSPAYVENPYVGDLLGANHIFGQGPGIIGGGDHYHNHGNRF